MTESLVVEDFERREVYAFASPGVELLNVSISDGSLEGVSLESLDAIIEVDLPFIIPLPDEDFLVGIENGEVQIRHRTKVRGEEVFSTLNSRILPRFSSLRIAFHPAFVDRPIASEFDGLFPHPNRELPPNTEGWYFESFVIVLRVLRRIEDFLQTQGVKLLDGIPVLSHRMAFVDRVTGASVFRTIYPYNDLIDLSHPLDRITVDRDSLRQYLAASFRVAEFGRTETAPKTLDAASFRERVFLTLHDFVFYCRQHAGSLQVLDESMIRDLYLVLLKAVFKGSAEGEAYHYDGKLDFKVKNPEAQHEFVTGEFKWWRGGESAKEILEQALRKHASGQEAEVFCVILSKRTNQELVFREAVATLDARDEIEGSKLRELPLGSVERWQIAQATMRDRMIPVNLVLADLYHERVKV